MNSFKLDLSDLTINAIPVKGSFSLYTHLLHHREFPRSSQN